MPTFLIEEETPDHNKVPSLSTILGSCFKFLSQYTSHPSVLLGTTTIRTNDISYNSQKPDISYADNWYKNETGHFVQKTFRTKIN